MHHRDDVLLQWTLPSGGSWPTSSVQGSAAILWVTWRRRPSSPTPSASGWVVHSGSVKHLIIH